MASRHFAPAAHSAMLDDVQAALDAPLLLGDTHRRLQQLPGDKRARGTDDAKIPRKLACSVERGGARAVLEDEPGVAARAFGAQAHRQLLIARRVELNEV